MTVPARAKKISETEAALQARRPRMSANEGMGVMALKNAGAIIIGLTNTPPTSRCAASPIIRFAD
jgi:Asp-tRNA(Asn)/Glu-tRNA(Gln) amidotransferase A subunit family amidase